MNKSFLLWGKNCLFFFKKGTLHTIQDKSNVSRIHDNLDKNIAGSQINKDFVMAVDII